MNARDEEGLSPRGRESGGEGLSLGTTGIVNHNQHLGHKSRRPRFERLRFVICGIIADNKVRGT